MLLTKVIINDFGVYRGRNEFNFQTEPGKPIILCGGTNGAGKTTLFESVMLCFYGQNSFEQKTSQKQYHDRILRKIHRYLGTKKSADETSIIIEFQFAHEGKIVEYQVMRMWQNNDGKIDETFTIKKKNPSDEKFVKLDSIEESAWQIFIEQLIPKKTKFLGVNFIIESHVLERPRFRYLFDEIYLKSIERNTEKGNLSLSLIDGTLTKW